ncbi:MAG: ABC transporter ATP-binding protein [Patescibacteria group bacterium]
MDVLSVSGLTKHYDGYTAVDHISFSIKRGEIVGLLGPNGAGKTTTIQMLLGLTLPDDGEILYFGKNFLENREQSLSRMNFASSYSAVQGRMTVYQNLRIYAGLYGVKETEKVIRQLLELMDIVSIKDQVFWKLSSGQKTRVILAKAFINNPELLLMDEPTASLDPEIAEKVIEILLELRRSQGVSILYTSHDMEEVEALCDRVIFLDHGKILAEDTPLGFTKRIGDCTLIVTFDGEQKTVVSHVKSKKYAYKFPRDEVIEVSLPENDIPALLFDLGKKKIWITNIDVKKPRLEDVFLQIAKGQYEHREN